MLGRQPADVRIPAPVFTGHPQPAHTSLPAVGPDHILGCLFEIITNRYGWGSVLTPHCTQGE